MSFPPNQPYAPQPEGPDNQQISQTAPIPARGGFPPAEEPVDPWLAAAEPAPEAGGAWRRARHLGWEFVQTLVLAALIFLAVRAMAQNFRVEGSSMEPGLHDGQYLLVNKAIYFKINLDRLARYLPFVNAGSRPQRFLFRPPDRGDVIVFQFPRDPGRDFIKRVIGVPGDRIEIKGGIVYINDNQLDETYIEHNGRYDFPQMGFDCVRAGPACQVPAGNYFVLGDNRGNSFDSHAWGFVPEENIIGQAMLSYWPLSELGGAGNRSINLGFVSIPIP